MKGLFKREGEGKTFEASDHWPVFLCLLDFRVLEGQTGGSNGKHATALANLCVHKAKICVFIYIHTYTCMCLPICRDNRY